MSKLFLCTLSDNVINGNRPKYNKDNIYYYGEKNSKNNPDKIYGYHLDYLEGIYKFDKIICIGTNKSDWEYFYKYIVLEKFPEINLKFDFQLIEKESDKRNDFKRKILDITNGSIEIIYVEEKLSKSRIKQVIDISNDLDDYDEIFIDVTGGIRTISFMITQIISNIISLGKIRINKISMIGVDFYDNKGVIINQNGIFEEIEKINEITALIRYGNFKELSVLKDEILKDELEEFVSYQQLMLYNKMNNFSEYSKIVKDTKFSNKFLTLVLNKLKYDWNINISKKNKNTEIDAYFKIMKNYVNYKNKSYGLLMLNKILELNESYHPYILEKRFNDLNIEEIFEKKKEIKKVKNYISHNFTYTESININDTLDLIDITNSDNLYQNILILGLGIIDYNECECRVKARFTLSHLLSYNKNYDEVYIITTREAEDKNKIEMEKEIKTIYPDFDTNKIKYLYLKRDKNNPELEIEETYNLIYDLCEIFKGGQYKITLDITHLQRYNIYMMYIYLHLMEMIYKNFKINEVCYFYFDNIKKTGEKEDGNELILFLDKYKNYNDFRKGGRYENADENNLIQLKFKELSEIFMNNDFNRLKKIDKNLSELKGTNPLEIEMLKKIKEIYTEIPKDDLEFRIWFIKKQFEFSNYLYAVYDLVDLYRNNIMKFRKNEENYEKSKEAFVDIKKLFYDKYPKEVKEFEKLFVDKSNNNFRVINSIKKTATHEKTNPRLTKEKTIKYKKIINELILFIENNILFIKEVRNSRKK